MIDILYLKKLIESKDEQSLARYIKEKGLSLENNKIVADSSLIKHSYDYYDKRQLVRKILLNSALIPSALV